MRRANPAACNGRQCLEICHQRADAATVLGLPGTLTLVAVEGSFINGGQDHVGEAMSPKKAGSSDDARELLHALPLLMAVKAKSIICISLIEACPHGLRDLEDALIGFSTCPAFPAAAGPLQTERALGHYKIPTSLAGEAIGALNIIYLYIYTRIYTYICIHSYTYVSMCLCISIAIFVFAYIYIYIQIDGYVDR